MIRIGCQSKLLPKGFRLTSQRLLKRIEVRSFSSEVEAENDALLSPGDLFRKTHKIGLSGAFSNDQFDPILSFEETPFSDSIKSALASQGYTSPTAIQAQAWAIALKGKDLVAVARTGSGKTCGFLLPAFHSVLSASANTASKTGSSRARRVPRVLVLSPTRELCVQITTEAQKFARATGLRSVALYGGVSRGPQMEVLHDGRCKVHAQCSGISPPFCFTEQVWTW